MSDSGIHVNDVGTLLRLTLSDGGASALNISTASVRQFRLLAPNGASYLKSASFGSGGGVDGVLQYQTIDGDLPVAGVWRIQPYIETPSASWHGSMASFDVFANVGGD